MNLFRLLRWTRSQLQNLTALGSALYSVFELLVGVVASLIAGRLAPKLPDEVVGREALIICPSPLLNHQAINWERRGGYIISFLNSACLSPKFPELRPERYFLIDPAYFRAHQSLPDQPWANGEVERIVARIIDTTDWPMTIYVPWHYRNSRQALRMAGNPNIKIGGIPTFSQSHSRNRLIKNLGFKLGVLSPLYQNVLSAAIFFNVKVGHKRVFLWGAHHTWLKDNRVDQHNRLLQAVRHTDQQVEGLPVLNCDGSPRPLHVFLRQLSPVFEQYHFLRHFAECNGQIIINATEDSYIDAFERTADIPLFSASADVVGVPNAVQKH